MKPASDLGIYLIQAVLALALRPSLWIFYRKLKDPQASQEALIRKITKELASCEYGKQIGVVGPLSALEFRMRVPVVEYADLTLWVERQKQFDIPLLSSVKPVLYERTSGSSGSAKYIPYTPRLKRAFSRMAGLWIGDILNKGPKLSSGKVFISVSPAFSTESKTERGVPVGLEDDSEYMSPLMRKFLSNYWVMPDGLKGLKDPTDYRWVLACALLAEDRLEVVSIWNPTYFTALLEFIFVHRSKLTMDWQQGKCRRGGRDFYFKPISERRLLLLNSASSFASVLWQEIWPELKLISCWRDASAESFALELAALFPKVFIQAKGLLATECPMTFPWIGAPAAVPLVDEVFYEFQDDCGALHFLHELEIGQDYELIVTVRGGFHRYRIGDRVRVVGREQKTPCFKFIGRGGQVSDLVGEKLNEIFVRETFAEISELCQRFWFLIPDLNQRPPRYVLIIDEVVDRAQLSSTVLDQALCRAVHYEYARKLEQLGQLEICLVRGAREFYIDYFTQRGMKWGDIKFVSLITRQVDARGMIEKIKNWI